MTSAEATEKITPINVAYPDAPDLRIHITEGACQLKLTPGAGDAWITGAHKDPTGVRPPRVIQEGGDVRITEDQHPSGFWGALWSGRGFAPPIYELALGNARPYRLTIEIGASENTLDLGGLPISHLALKHGAGKTVIDFSAPNPQPMSLLEISAGAGSTELRNLANANCAEIIIEGGVAEYKLDFGGTLQRDAHVRVSTGLSSVTVTIPAATAARITADMPLGHIEPAEGFTHRDGAFWTPAAVEGAQPTLTISASVALGSLTLRTQ
ncbi:MAG TPA: hypothetical protein VFQ25_04805 [Ktedonobacterales bacterium]|nr:hypothetical protein [Ktedonobacterales bacterium]